MYFFFSNAVSRQFVAFLTDGVKMYCAIPTSEALPVKGSGHPDNKKTTTNNSQQYLLDAQVLSFCHHTITIGATGI